MLENVSQWNRPGEEVHVGRRSCWTLVSRGQLNYQEKILALYTWGTGELCISSFQKDVNKYVSYQPYIILAAKHIDVINIVKLIFGFKQQNVLVRFKKHQGLR